MKMYVYLLPRCTHSQFGLITYINTWLTYTIILICLCCLCPGWWCVCYSVCVVVRGLLAVASPLFLVREFQVLRWALVGSSFAHWAILLTQVISYSMYFFLLEAEQVTVTWKSSYARTNFEVWEGFCIYCLSGAVIDTMTKSNLKEEILLPESSRGLMSHNSCEAGSWETTSKGQTGRREHKQLSNP